MTGVVHQQRTWEFQPGDLVKNNYTGPFCLVINVKNDGIMTWLTLLNASGHYQPKMLCNAAWCLPLAKAPKHASAASDHEELVSDDLR